MRYRKLTPTGDYSFGGQQNDFYINVPAAVAQAVKTTLLLFQGEWYLDINAGTPYFEGILGKHSKDLADATFVDTINNVQGVVNIKDFNSTVDPNTRKYSEVTGVLNTIYGETELQIQNEGNF